MERTRVTCAAPVNIAVIKYWGKRDEQLVLPLNDSLSATLDCAALKSTTTACADPSFQEDKLWLDGKEHPFGQRLKSVTDELRRRAASAGASESLLKSKIHLCSRNNFPTAAGLASSAAGYACLVYALSKLYNVSGDISSLARLGSGSACRSVYGGFVRWHAGSLTDGSDSIALQIKPAESWPEMRILILVVDDRRKKTSSTNGMKNSVLTSEFLKYRTSKCVPERLKAIIKAINKKDFNTFAEITMKDSNQFHSVCLDTFPPCFYMNDVSRMIIEMVHSYNEACGENKVAYTFDAGPNACLFMLEKEVPYFYSLIEKMFPRSIQNENYVKGIPISEKPCIKLNLEPNASDLLKYIISTKVGDGPYQIEDANEHLLDEDGNPKELL